MKQSRLVLCVDHFWVQDFLVNLKLSTQVLVAGVLMRTAAVLCCQQLFGSKMWLAAYTHRPNRGVQQLCWVRAVSCFLLRGWPYGVLAPTYRVCGMHRRPLAADHSCMADLTGLPLVYVALQICFWWLAVLARTWHTVALATAAGLAACSAVCLFGS